MRKRPFTFWTVVACVAVFLAEPIGSHGYNFVVGAGNLPPLIAAGGFNPGLVSSGQVWRLLTSAYLHFSLIHLGLNMVGLLYAGWILEPRFGSRRLWLIYLGSVLGGDIASFPFSAEAVVAGASGGIMGLFGGLVVVGIRYWLERDQLGWALVPIVATLLGGIGHSNIATPAHLGGAIAGFAIAWGIGVSPAWKWREQQAQQRLLSDSLRTARARDQALPAASVVQDPSNRLVLRIGGKRKLFFIALGVVSLTFPALIVLIAGLEFIEGRGGVPPTPAMAGGLFFLACGAICAWTLGARITLGPLGFRPQYPLLRGRFVRWVDVQDFGTMMAGQVEYATYRLTPAAALRKKAALSRFFGSGSQLLQVFGGMKPEDFAALLEEWRQRWTPDVSG